MEPTKYKHRVALEAACKLAGSQAALARLIGAFPQQIGNWLTYCARIESVLDRRVTRQQLRPDDWHSVWPELAREREIAP
jgi:DNA-binding transcriptional regulator YdaS (Cro superfamily)